MPREDPPLSFLSKHGVKLMVYCLGCKRSGEVEPGPLIEKFGHSYPIQRVQHHLKCTACGSRKATVFW
jgi:hypothetical protein